MHKQQLYIRGTIVNTELINPNSVNVIAKVHIYPHKMPFILRLCEAFTELLDLLSYVFDMPNYGGTVSFLMHREFELLPQQEQQSGLNNETILAKFTFSAFQPSDVVEPSTWPWVRAFTKAELLYNQFSSGDQIMTEGSGKDVIIRRKKEKSRPRNILITNDQKKLGRDFK